MITGVHMILYSSEAERARALLADILESRTVDADHGWLIFRSPRPRSPCIRWPRARPKVWGREPDGMRCT